MEATKKSFVTCNAEGRVIVLLYPEGTKSPALLLPGLSHHLTNGNSCVTVPDLPSSPSTVRLFISCSPRQIPTLTAGVGNGYLSHRLNAEGTVEWISCGYGSQKRWYGFFFYRYCQFLGLAPCSSAS